MVLHFYAFGLIAIALLPALMMVRNLHLFRTLPRANEAWPIANRENIHQRATVSVLIPARNEQSSIGSCLEHVLQCNWHELEVIVLDDSSTDATFEICSRIAARDNRLSIVKGGVLPAHWNGKQHACWQMAQSAHGDWLLFIDADVRLSEDAIPRLLHEARSLQVDLLSGFPKQVTGTWSEKLMIPLMHFILLGYLPIDRMRTSPGAEFAAGCGQLFFARRTAYEVCEGHKAIAGSRHDGLKLPRHFRKHGLKTDIFDASNIASCRMYHNARQVVVGLLKNATEGIAHPRTIVIFSLLLAGAAVLPAISLIVAVWQGANSWLITELLVATGISYVPRLQAAQRFEQSWLGALLHPVGVLAFLLIQWCALVTELLGYRVRWRGRT